MHPRPTPPAPRPVRTGAGFGGWRPTDPRLAERFEFYVCGVELANAFGELTDPVEQRRRFLADMDEKQRIYGERYPLDEDFLAALAHMPAASGCALGFEQGRISIHQTLAVRPDARGRAHLPPTRAWLVPTAERRGR